MNRCVRLIRPSLLQNDLPQTPQLDQSAKSTITSFRRLWVVHRYYPGSVSERCHVLRCSELEVHAHTVSCPFALSLGVSFFRSTSHPRSLVLTEAFTVGIPKSINGHDAKVARFAQGSLWDPLVGRSIMGTARRVSRRNKGTLRAL